MQFSRCRPSKFLIGWQITKADQSEATGLVGFPVAETSGLVNGALLMAQIYLHDNLKTDEYDVHNEHEPIHENIEGEHH